MAKKPTLPSSPKKGGRPLFSWKLFSLGLVALIGLASLGFVAVSLGQPTALDHGRRRPVGRPTGRRRPRSSDEDEEELEEEELEEEEEEEETSSEVSQLRNREAPDRRHRQRAQERKPAQENREDEVEEEEEVTPASLVDLATRIATGKLYFLFILKDHLPNADVWAAFFRNSAAGSVGLFAHCKNMEACQQSSDFRALGIKLVPTVPSKWCVDLVTPTWQLVRYALEADASAHEGQDSSQRGPRKYIFVSDSSLPLRPLESMRRVLLKTDRSDICMTAENQWASVDVFGVTYKIVKSHQWAILNHPDAESYVRGWEQLNTYGQYVKDGNITIPHSDYKWLVPQMGRNGRANLSATLHRKSILAHGRCPDEEALTSLIWGMYETRHAHRWKKIFARSLCRTWVNWHCKKPPEVFTKFTDKLKELSQNTSDSAYLFARKFKAKAKLEDLKRHLQAERF